MILDLCGAWSLFREGESREIAASVPGCVHADLLTAGLLTDPFEGMNEADAQWVSRANWIYRREFEVCAGLLEHQNVLLCFEGLDTVADVFLNGHLLGRTDNMFRQWEFDVRDVLVTGKNEIEIRFTSPVAWIEHRQTIRPIRYPTAPHQIPGFSQIRKAAFSFGWDWGPCLAGVGIWRPVTLRALQTARLREVRIEQDHSPGGSVDLSVEIILDRSVPRNLESRIVLEDGEGLLESRSLAIHSDRGNLNLRIENPKLWWPRGMGGQPLYRLRVELSDPDSGEKLDVWERRIGLRVLRLEHHADEWGNAFQFSANGVPFFVKGANWIPADAILTRVGPGVLRDRLEAAAGAHMNMLRVWGGGIYEPEEFYDLCDELGLCVWQDFMFACAPYPLDEPEFVQNVETEIREQIQRLRHHACLTVWCGNNELEMCGFVAPNADDGHMGLADYTNFFSGKIPSLLEELAPGQSYWPGSPFKEAGTSYNPDVWIESPDRGDAHIWSVWHVRKPFEAYRECHHRFISEFGFQSFPGPGTVRRFAAKEEHSIESATMRHHQRSGDGNSVIRDYLLDWFRPPKDFESTLWCSQILQGLALQYACEHWRRAKPRTMGTLYWQLNDAWPGASWSTIDYFGHWKAAHYFARRFYAPLLVSAVEDKGTVHIHGTSDLRHQVECTLKWKLTDLHGNTLRHGQSALSVAPQSNDKRAELNFPNELAQHKAENLLLWLHLDKEGEKVADNLILFARPKHLELPDPELTWSITETSQDFLTVRVTAKKPALWTWLELSGPGVHYSDNFFHMEPTSPIDIRVHAAGRKSGPLAPDIRIRSLFDTY